MINNHIKIAFRTIYRKKAQSITNIIGLVASMTFVLLIAAYIWQAYQVNSHLRNKDRQFVLQSSYKQPGIGLDLTTVGALPKALKEQYPDLVADYYRLDGLTCIISNGATVYEEKVSVGDPSILTMYGFELLAGDPHTALNSPTSVVLKEEAAIKYFGETDVVGRRLSIRNFAGEKQDFEVTAVLKSTIQNSVMELMPALQTSIFLPISSEKYFDRSIDNWSNIWIVGFLELQEGVTPDQLNLPIEKLLHEHADKQIAENLVPKLNPLPSYYLDDNKGAIRQLILILSCTAAFLIVMATVNFINFSISQSFTRLKEIGVRKIMGSSKIRLIFQLLIEYNIIVFIAACIALFNYPLLAPLFSSIMMKTLPSLTDLPTVFFICFALGTLCLGLLAGLYPAIRLSKNPITSAVKNQFPDFGGKHIVRQVLLFVQFTVALIVLISSIVISRQVDTFINGNLGYNKDYLLTVQVPRDWSEKGLHQMEVVQQELKQLPQVQDISLSYGVPNAFGNGIQKIKKVGAEQDIDALLITSDQHFASTYQIPLLAGEFFAAQADESITSKLVINLKAAFALGYATAEEAIGQRITLFEDSFSGIIAGVTADFYANSMHSSSPAVVWFPLRATNQYRFLSIRLKAGPITAALAPIEKKWKQLMPEAPFDYKFMDQTLESMYNTEFQLQRAAKLATGISIIIVGLGIIGLTSLSINLRLKEIGIRKVLGASLHQIIFLFSKEFYVTFSIALAVGIPISYMFMKHWLANYVLRTKLDSTLFILPMLALALLIFCFIGILIIRSTKHNPIKHLRDE
ncbi:ABC transporter permease [Sphingobacterium sp. LRF_L2]|uniref:ABC transporter permease n=1 Tax=Sphingobacterium sp. LRF_L2 TaxID=3369421 RepID=UPI003F635152